MSINRSLKSHVFQPVAAGKIARFPCRQQSRFCASRLLWPARFMAMPSILVNVLLQTLHSAAFAAIVIAG
jgi:hypothetical protein